ncbi:hypothetical protein Tsubulata_017792 [Turnera subulata]|uniref:Uncharacterized protein n=1 Tax=Turnera subulata TaxID=218843 RepID=A0A9Q0FZC6_9ROSI|nr:hypothetical protein Tsubulata_017792 [Turnera subulata]
MPILPEGKTMNGGHSMYSKLRQVSILKSRAEDFSDHYPPLQTSKARPSHDCKSLESTETKVTKKNVTHEAVQVGAQEEEVGQIFGEILSRSCSRSSACSAVGSRSGKHSSGLEIAVKRAFSMRRSSSVSEGYCRIHDQSDLPADPVGKASSAHATRTQKKKGKIMKACRLLFGF